MDEFTARRRLHAQRSASTGLVPLYAKFLTKAGRPSRLYRIDPIGRLRWKAEVWIGASLHRVHAIGHRSDARMIANQFEREVCELLADGWTEA